MMLHQRMPRLQAICRPSQPLPLAVRVGARVNRTQVPGCRHLSTNTADSTPSWLPPVEAWCNKVYANRGQTTFHRTSQLEADIMHRLHATFNLPTLPYYDTLEQYKQNQVHIHPAAHLTYFSSHTNTNRLPISAFSKLAGDGYEDDYSPPKPFTLRMFAGGKIEYTLRDKQSDELRLPYIGEVYSKKSVLAEQPFIKHGKSGYLCFVSVQHEWKAAAGDTTVLKEVQRYVYRTPPEQQSKTVEQQTASKPKPSSQSAPRPYDIERTDIRFDEVLLFRYSAISWNAHQIHYDQAWAASEGYSGVLVHGPLQASCLIDTIHTHLQKTQSGVLASFEYRAMKPLVVNTKVKLVAWKNTPKRSRSDGLEEYTMQVIPADWSDTTPYMTATALVQPQ